MTASGDKDDSMLENTPCIRLERYVHKPDHFMTAAKDRRTIEKKKKAKDRRTIEKKYILNFIDNILI